MKTSRIEAVRMRHVAAFAALALVSLPAIAGHLSSKPGVYEARTELFTHGKREVHVECVTPAKPRTPVTLILFATGDAGWYGASGAVYEHMAEEGYYVAAFDSREIVKPVEESGGLVEIADAAAVVEAILVKAKADLGLPETTPVIVTGYSRGANLVVFTSAVKTLQHHLGGAVAIALTRELDFLKAPAAADRPANVQVDEKGRIQTYPAIERAGSLPFAVIQAKGDSYVKAEEARRLFGPDSPTRRLYEVDARNHGFSGGRDELIRDVDDALRWIEGIIAAR